MRAGNYRHRVVFYENEPTTNDARQRVDDWKCFCIRFGRSPKEQAAREEIIPDANRSQIEPLVMYFRSDSRTRQITPRFRASYLDRSYEIETIVDPDGLQKELKVVFKVREVQR